VAFRFHWPASCESVPDEIRGAAESHLGRLWICLSERKTSGGTTADFRLSLEDWTLRYAIDLDAHTVLLREATSDRPRFHRLAV
jgi:hypothetical protein